MVDLQWKWRAKIAPLWPNMDAWEYALASIEITVFTQGELHLAWYSFEGNWIKYTEKKTQTFPAKKGKLPAVLEEGFFVRVHMRSVDFARVAPVTEGSWTEDIDCLDLPLHALCTFSSNAAVMSLSSIDLRPSFAEVVFCAFFFLRKISSGCCIPERSFWRFNFRRLFQAAIFRRIILEELGPWVCLPGLDHDLHVHRIIWCTSAAWFVNSLTPLYVNRYF